MHDAKNPLYHTTGTFVSSELCHSLLRILKNHLKDFISETKSIF